MADDRSTEIRNFKAQLQALQHPAVWGVGVLLLLLFWLEGHDKPSSDQSLEQWAEVDSVEVPTTASNSSESQPDGNSGIDLNSLLTDPTLLKFGVNGTDSAVQLGLLNSMLPSPLSSSAPTPKSGAFSINAARSSEDESSLEELDELDDSTLTESASAQSSLRSYSSLRPSASRSGQRSNSQVSTASTGSPRSVVDRRSKPQTTSQRNLWQVDFSANESTNAATSALTNLSGQAATSELLGASSLFSRPIGSSANTPPTFPAGSAVGQTSSTAGGPNDATPPAFRTPIKPPSPISSGSSFRTQNSSQIIRTFETPPGSGSGAD